MPGKLDIMHAIREGLDTIHFASDVGWADWTTKVKTKLCEIGHRFGCYVCASQPPEAECSEWLYDMTWLEYTSHKVGEVQTSGWLIGAHLVAECEWAHGNNPIGEVEDDFSKLLLARAGVRLMICYDRHSDGPEGMAKQLAEFVQRFNGTRAEDAYLLAVLGWDDGLEAFKFNYFTLGLHGTVAWS